MAAGLRKYYKARGIVLHTVKYGDTGMVAYLLTDIGGRRSYMVQGVRSHSGRGSKMALFQPMFPVELEGAETARGELHRFREVHAAYPLQTIPFDIRKSTLALFMAEVLYRLVRECEPNSGLFDFIWASVEALDFMDEGVSDFHLWFMAHLSRYLGFCPGNDYLSGAWFDIKEGMYVMQMPTHPCIMDRDCAFILNALLASNVSDLGSLGLNREHRRAFLNAMLVYFGYHLDAVGSVQSIRILQEVF